MMNKILKNNQGFTLLEIIVSLSIFSLIVVMAVGIFLAVMTSQQRAVVAQNEQESLKYVFEVFSKDLRGAIRSDDDCELTVGDATRKIFNNDTTEHAPNDTLYFADKDDKCTYYYINNGVLIQDKDGVVSSTTPEDVSVKSFDFSIYDNLITDTPNTKQPMITFSLEIEDRAGKAVEKQNMTVQTTISSRFYE